MAQVELAGVLAEEARLWERLSWAATDADDTMTPASRLEVVAEMERLLRKIRILVEQGDRLTVYRAEMALLKTIQAERWHEAEKAKEQVSRQMAKVQAALEKLTPEEYQQLVDAGEASHGDDY